MNLVVEYHSHGSTDVVETPVYNGSQMVDFENVIDIVTTGRPIEKENTHCDCPGSRTNVTIVWSMLDYNQH